jgi:hypothetical protein
MDCEAFPSRQSRSLPHYVAHRIQELLVNALDNAINPLVFAIMPPLLIA